MGTQKITRPDIRNEEELKAAVVETSKENPRQYVTYFVSFGEVKIYLHDRKPQSTSASGAEYTYKHEGGFFKNGKVVKPSQTWIKKYNFCPVLG